MTNKKSEVHMRKSWQLLVGSTLRQLPCIYTFEENTELTNLKRGNDKPHEPNLKGEKIDEIREQIPKRENMSNFYYFFGLFF